MLIMTGMMMFHVYLRCVYNKDRPNGSIFNVYILLMFYMYFIFILSFIPLALPSSVSHSAYFIFYMSYSPCFCINPASIYVVMVWSAWGLTGYSDSFSLQVLYYSLVYKCNRFFKQIF